MFTAWISLKGCGTAKGILSERHWCDTFEIPALLDHLNPHACVLSVTAGRPHLVFRNGSFQEADAVHCLPAEGLRTFDFVLLHWDEPTSAHYDAVCGADTQSPWQAPGRVRMALEAAVQTSGLCGAFMRKYPAEARGLHVASVET